MSKIIPIAKCTTVLDLLRPEERWVQETEAEKTATSGYMEGDLVECSPRDAHAETFCLIGAMKRIYTGPALKRAKRKLIKALGHGMEDQTVDVITSFNDSPRVGHEDVLRVVKAAGI